MPVSREARLRAAERAADHVVAERAAQIARRPIESAEEAVELLLVAECEPDWDDRMRVIMGRLTEEARVALVMILKEAIATAEPRGSGRL